MTDNFSSFPNIRLRRNRKSAEIRDLLAEVNVLASDLIMPFFVIEGKNVRQDITNMPEIYRFSIDLLILEAKKCQEVGIKAIMLFPAIEQSLKDATGSEALNENNLICRAIKALKKEVPNICLISDIALDPYTNHGHDGLISSEGEIINDKTCDILCKQALIQAKSGCDIIAPSDMMDGRIGRIRKYLDENDCQNTSIMSYAIKYASNFYGPFRNGVNSSQNLQGDKKTYQMDYKNKREAMQEIALDVNEGADMVIIKPGISYIDVVSQAKERFNIPIISYQVSGEYAMLKLAAKNDILDFDSAMIESLIAIKRAGARAIISYASFEIAQKLPRNNIK